MVIFTHLVYTLNSFSAAGGPLKTYLSFCIFLFLCVPAFGQSANVQKEIIVAVIDTGVDTHHPILKENLWQNPGETGVDAFGRDIATNGIDDDGNGYVDDVYGWDFLNNKKDIVDVDGHGTHISGIIKNTIPHHLNHLKLKFMILKYHDGKKTNSDKKGFVGRAFIKSLDYAVSQGASIINISGGGYKPNSQELFILKRAAEMGIPVVSAAGNKKIKTEDHSFYPAAYDLPNIYSVVATDGHGKVLPTSNINDNVKNYFAPGYRIFSSLPEGEYGLKTGSSQAAAYITGLLTEKLMSSPGSISSL